MFFYQRDDIIVDLVPINPTSNPPKTLGKLQAIPWPTGFLELYLVQHQGQNIQTLSPQMQLQMKQIIAEFFQTEMRPKDLTDVEALEGILKKTRI
jgi:hypothetical protein